MNPPSKQNGELLSVLIVLAVSIVFALLAGQILELKSIYKISVLCLAVSIVVISAFFPRAAFILFCISPLLPDDTFRDFSVPGLNPVSGLFGLAIFSYFLNRLQNKIPPIRPNKRLLLPVCIVGILLLVSALRSNVFANPIQALISFWIGPIIVLCIIFAAQYIFQNWHIQKYSWTIYALTLFILIDFAKDRLTGGLFNKMTSGYLAGNRYANTMMVLIPFLVALIPALQKRWRMPARILVLGVIASVLLSQTRGALLALMALFVGYTIFTKRITVPAKLVLIASAAMLFSNSLNEAIKSITSQLQATSVMEFNKISSGRIGIWEQALNYISDDTRFFIGGGAGDFEKFYSNWDTHNHILKIWCDSGLVGVIIILALYLTVWRIGYEALRQNDPILQELGKGACLSCITATVAGLFTHSQLGTAFLAPFWIQAGTLVGYQAYLANRRNLDETAAPITNRSSVTIHRRIHPNRKLPTQETLS